MDVILMYSARDHRTLRVRAYEAAVKLSTQLGPARAYDAVKDPTPARKNREFQATVCWFLTEMSTRYYWFRRSYRHEATVALALARSELWAYAHDAEVYWGPDELAAGDGLTALTVDVVMPDPTYDRLDVIFSCGGYDVFPDTDTERRIFKAWRWWEACDGLAQ